MVTVIIAWIVVGLAALAGFVLIQYARKHRKPKVVGYEPADRFVHFVDCFLGAQNREEETTGRTPANRETEN